MVATALALANGTTTKIIWKAVQMLAEHDEGGLHIQTFRARFDEGMGDLVRDQLPTIHIAADALA